MRDCGSCGHHAIDIQTTLVDLWLTGVGLYGGEEGAAHDVTVIVAASNADLSKVVPVNRTIVSDGSKTPLRFALTNPVFIRSGNRYTITVFMKGPKTWSGEGGVDLYHFSEFGSKIVFCDSPSAFTSVPNDSDSDTGQIPELYCVKVYHR